MINHTRTTFSTYHMELQRNDVKYCFKVLLWILLFEIKMN